MGNIPTKADLDNNKNNQAEIDRQQRIKDDVTSFTAQIVAAMGKNQTSLTVQLRMPEPEAQTQLKADFKASGWTLDFQSARTGGRISWS